MKSFGQLPRRGGLAAVRHSVLLEIRAGNSEGAYALTKILVRLARQREERKNDSQRKRNERIG